MKNYFWQEAKVLALYQQLFSDGYIFTYKLPIEWDPLKCQILRVHRKKGHFWDLVPLILFTLAIFCCFVAIISIQENIADDPQDITYSVRLLFQFALAIGIFAIFWAYLLFLNYVDDLTSGLNMLIKMFYRVDGRIKGGGRPSRKYIVDVMCLILTAGMLIFVSTLQTVIIPVFLYFEFDPVGHMVYYLLHVAPVFRYIGEFVFGRYYCDWLSC